MTEPFHQALRRVARNPYCQVEGCDRKRSDFARFCWKHRLNRNNWGGPLNGPASIKEINANVKRVKQFFADHPNHAGIKEALAYIDTELFQAGRLRAPEFLDRQRTPKERLLFYFRVLGEYGHTAVDVFAVMIAHYVFAIENPDFFSARGTPDKRMGKYKWKSFLAGEDRLPLARQFTRRIIMLVKPEKQIHAFKGTVQWWSPMGTRLSTQALDLLATMMMKKLGVLATRIAKEVADHYVPLKDLKPVKHSWEPFSKKDR